MTDFRMKEVRALLNTTMESILRRAMFEIMKIVENSLHDHQLELSQKGEEIVQLKVKLQSVELKLRDALDTNYPPELIDKQLDDIQREPEDVTKATTQPLVPETDFEIPEDWCAPVGYEMPTIPDEGSCPSVRLRKLSIPLYPIPVKKQEETDLSISPQRAAGGPRRSKRGTLPIQEGNQTQNKSLTATDRNVQSKKVRGDIAKLLHETTKVKGSAATESEPAEQQTEENHCRFCEASFDTEFGRDVHERYHTWCRGCKKSFPSPNSLVSHKAQCKVLLGLAAKKTQSKTASGPLSNVSRKGTTPSQDRPANSIDTVIQHKSGKKKHFCVVCNRKFLTAAKQQRHMRTHTGNPFFCCFCPKKFCAKQSLKVHLQKIHKDQVNSGLTKVDLALTEPLEVIEESAVPGKASSTSVNQKKRSRKEPFGSKEKHLGWKDYGSKVLGGYSCNVCHQVEKTKSLLVKHQRVHTKVKPYQCPCCHAHFKYQGAFSTHYKKCIKSLHDKGISNLPTDSSFSSNVKEEVSLLQDASETT